MPYRTSSQILIQNDGITVREYILLPMNVILLDGNNMKIGFCYFYH